MSPLQVGGDQLRAFRLPDLASAATRQITLKTASALTLLHFTDTHAQLETHPEYLPGAMPEIQMMGGYARLKTAIERERATLRRGPASCWTEAMSSRVRDQLPGPKAK